MDDVTAIPQGSGPGQPPPAPRARIVSLDALRGFDMFWIVGGESLVHALNKAADTRATRLLAAQFEHADWEGFRFYDLIFPLFVFVVGASLVFSLGRTLAESGRGAALRRLGTRSLALVLLGIVYYGGLSQPWPDIRLLGVLQRIGLCYCLAGLIFIAFERRPRVMVWICAGLLVGYALGMHLVPFPDIRLDKASVERLAAQVGCAEHAALAAAANGCVSGVYEKGYNLANYVDFRYLPGKKWDTYFDPEGLLSTLPAVGSCLLGVFAGLLLRSPTIPGREKVKWLLLAGVVALGAGASWGLCFPVIKAIWTSSFVLVAGACSFLLLGVFYLVVDVWKCQTWCRPLVWIGMNPIALYLAAEIVNFRALAERLAGGDFKAFLDLRLANGLGDLAVAAVEVGLVLGLARLLYQRKIFLRL